MTACVIMDTLEKYNIDPDEVKIKILESSTTPVLGGTSADLLPNDKLTVTELMYGMMLPSGNDAAQSMAIYFGNLMLKLAATE
jgi:serine-type D-Ala-D-Ala carboxypeptidase (penicillin-binding protein 5/6)